MADKFTKWVELAALPAQNAVLTARAFLNYFIVTFGCPLEVHIDKVAILKVIYSRHFVSYCISLRPGPTLSPVWVRPVWNFTGSSFKWSALTYLEMWKIWTSTFPHIDSPIFYEKQVYWLFSRYAHAGKREHSTHRLDPWPTSNLSLGPSILGTFSPWCMTWQGKKFAKFSFPRREIMTGSSWRFFWTLTIPEM